MRGGRDRRGQRAVSVDTVGRKCVRQGPAEPVDAEECERQRLRSWTLAGMCGARSGPRRPGPPLPDGLRPPGPGLRERIPEERPFTAHSQRTSYGVSVTAFTRGTGPRRHSKQQGPVGCSRGVDSSRRDAGVGTTDVVIRKPGLLGPTTRSGNRANSMRDFHPNDHPAAAPPLAPPRRYRGPGVPARGRRPSARAATSPAALAAGRRCRRRHRACS